MLRGKFVLPLFFSLFFLDSGVFSNAQFPSNFLQSFTTMVLLLCYTKCIISRWAWSAYWLAFNNCRLWDSSYRCGSNNECSELLRFKFWLSMMYSFRKFSLNWIFPKKSLLSSSFQVSSEISNSRVEFSETLENRIFCDSSDSHKYRSVNLSLTSTLHHWSQNLLFLLFLSLATDSRLRAFLAFRLRNKITNEKLFETEDSNTVETPNRPVFSIMFFENRRNCGSDRWWASCHHPRKYSWRTRWYGLFVFASDLAK